jgi:fatty-acyl-CoA synthase
LSGCADAPISFESLTPSTFLDRAAVVYGDRIAIVDGERRFSYAEFHDRSLRLTGVLASHRIQPGDRVAALCSNSHTMLELHNAIPLRGAVMVPLNTRLSEPELTYIIEHSGARLLIATHEFASLATRVAASTHIPILLAGGEINDLEAALRTAAPAPHRSADERALLAINYTSGTTGRPKGVMYHHRGAYLQALAMSYHAVLVPGSSYLWTLPMFHCNGWCFPWAVTAAGATHICLRAMDPAEVWRRMREGVTHFSAAPTVLTMLAEHPSASGDQLTRPVEVSTGGAPPSPALLQRMADLNIRITHLYGMTETFGPAIINQWQPEWDSLDEHQTAEMKARQGIPNIIGSSARVVNEDGSDVAADGASMGELVLRGNNVMLGYYNDPAGTAAATLNGWLRTGDLAVKHADGYVEIRDRLKDVIISGGENIASVEIERVLDSHPAVVESAVVGMPDELWGEVPVAFVTLRPGTHVSAADLQDFARTHVARFKVPKRIEFTTLPRTSTGKIQKNILRGATRVKVYRIP